MARVRFLGAEPVTVPELGGREIQPDQVVDVPDERFDGYVMQAVWESVEDPGAAKKTAAKSAPKGSDH